MPCQTQLKEETLDTEACQKGKLPVKIIRLKIQCGIVENVIFLYESQLNFNLIFTSTFTLFFNNFLAGQKLNILGNKKKFKMQRLYLRNLRLSQHDPEN